MIKQENLNNDIIKAAEKGDLANVMLLVDRRYNIYSTNVTNTEALRCSAKEGYLNIVKFLVEHESNTNINKDEALIYSAGKGHLEVVKYLIEQGADIHSKDNNALCWSAECGNIEIVKYLVEHEANIYARNDYALKVSAANRQLEVVEYLIIDCNMTIKPTTLEYLNKNNIFNVINIINSRTLHHDLNNSLNHDNKNNISVKFKV